MYEGKNIHYSIIDKKPLCSFSSKICNQHRLNGYAFCVRHILEDPTAPFRRCSYVAKSSKQKCTQAIPMHEEREYCNNHMQVLGMLPRKERKKKEKEKEKPPVISDGNLSIPVENKLLFEDRVKSRFESRRFHMSKLHKNDVLQHKEGSNLEDPEDPYAFPDSGGDSVSKVNSSTPPFLSGSAQDSATSVTTPNSTGAKSPGGSDSGVSSIAKLYPELAEKLEKIKPKFEISKTKDKGKEKSSRTMNILQSKIAQNKIKDKLKKNQESSSQSQSPSHGFNSVSSINLPTTPDTGIADRSLSSEAEGSNTHIDSTGGLLLGGNGGSTNHSLGGRLQGLQELKRPPQFPPYYPVVHSDVTSGASPVNMYPGGHHPHGNNALSGNLPPPPGLPEGIPHGMLPENLPGMPRADHLPQHLPHHSPASASPSRVDSMGLASPRSVSQRSNGPVNVPPLPLSSLSHQQYSHQSPLSQPSTPVDTANGTTPGIQQQKHLHRPFHRPSHLPVPHPLVDTVSHSPPVKPPPPYKDCSSSEVSSDSPSRTKPGVSTGAVTSPSVTVTSSPHQGNGLPPPPPYTAPSVPPKTPSKSKHSSKTTRNCIPVITQFMLPMSLTKPRKLKHVLPEDEASKKMCTDTALKYYMDFVRRKINNHNYVGQGLCSSDDDSSDDDMVDMLPWQPEWFTASSDEEACDDEDEQDGSLRTAKLALIRARMRRRCFQSRNSFRANTWEQKHVNDSTLSLIQAARDQAQCATTAVQEVKQKQPPPVDKTKLQGLLKRQCCHKNDEDVRCKNPVLPYTNHCLRHIMYNVDQQMFDYCTAKFADNTQCCVPVFDLKHELPLCVEHGIKADSYFDQEMETKPKRPRKKTKPSALTRPPKKGKKKKNQRKNIRPQKPSPPSEPTGITEMPPSTICTSTEVTMATPVQVTTTIPVPESTPPVVSDQTVTMVTETTPPASVSSPAREQKPATEQPTKETTGKPSLSDLPDASGLGHLSADMDKALELPLEQASRLLEEHDFQDVFNKIPDETFDIFADKSVDPLPTHEDMEELERHIEEANIDLSFAHQALDRFANGGMELDDEQLRILAATLLNNESGSLNTNSGSGEMCNGMSERSSIEEISRTLQSSAAELARTSAGNAQTHENALLGTGVSAGNIYHNVPYVNPLQDNRVLQQSNGAVSVTLNMPVTTTTTQHHFQHTNLDIPGVVGAHLTPNSISLPQQFLAHQNSLSSNFPANQSLSGQQAQAQNPQQHIYLQQQPSPHTSMPASLQNLPLSQIVTMSGVSGLRTPAQTTVGGTQLENLPSVMVAPDKSHHVQPPQLQTSLAGGHIPTWPASINVTNVLNFQNGFPGNFTPHSNDLAANLKFSVSAPHVIPSELKQELTQQYHQTLTLSHSTQGNNATGVGTETRIPPPAPQAGFDNVQFKRLPPQFSASSGSGS